MHENLLSAIETFYECAEDGFDHQRAITTFSQAVDNTGLCLVDLKLTAEFSLLASENIPPGAMSMMLNGPWNAENHGILRNFSIIPVGVPVLHRAVESDAEFYNSELYRTAMAPWRLHSIGLCLLDKDPAGGVLNGFIRNPGQGEIDHELLSRMALLNKHLWRAMQLRGRMDKIEEALIKTNNVLDLIEFGLVLYQKDGTPIFANAAARRIFDRKDGVVLEKSGISVIDREAQQQFRDLIAALSLPETPLLARAGGVVRVPRLSREKPYSLLAVPLNGRGMSGLDGVGTAVFLFDPSAERTTVIDLFVASYNLTHAEAMLASDLAEGTSLEDYAERRGISRNTAKTQLHSIFAKTDTSRQPELVSLLLRSVAGVNLKYS